ncbi:general odorant-binding protein 83a-like [Microplitis demolitor]|uniref:general odorant-binding protein 83a-like n=1 Tax=Microplitis demolitor TaxID=69319 RepID=UPI00235B6D82|nr:general odorant-binding protein 83a-like [Microplitis demolitor]
MYDFSPKKGRAWTPEQIENMMKPLGKSCAAKTGLTPELQEAHRKRDFVNDEKLKCYIHCICKMLKMFDKDNKINLDNIRKQVRIALPEEQAETSIKAHENCAAKGDVLLFYLLDERNL